MANRHTHTKQGCTTALATIVKKVKGIIENQLHQRQGLKLKMLFFKKLEIGMKLREVHGKGNRRSRRGSGVDSI